MKLNLSNEKRRFLLCLPLVAVPFCCLVFHVLGGGRAVAAGKAPAGLNPQLPAVTVDLQRAFQDKLKTYEQADKDSVRKAQWKRQDPYRKDSIVADGTKRLEEQLTRLRESMHRPAPKVQGIPATPRVSAVPTMPAAYPLSQGNAVERVTAPDPQLDRLNAMLDKVIRIQHPQEPSPARGVVGAAVVREEVGPADSTANSIAAIVPEDQTLVAGGTIALRIMDAIRVAGRVIPAGELVYGTVGINNDRLSVHVGALREDRNLYATDWQVYDLDGLAGIHIPGLLGREVAKQSVDQGVNSLNVLNVDPSLGAQAAGAGIQAAKSFLGRKVRQVRVTVRSGYRVLLRNPRMHDASQDGRMKPVVGKDSFAEPIQPPEWVEAGPVLEHCRSEGMEVLLRTIVIRDSCLWFGLEWRNRWPIVYTPAYMRWSIRDRRVLRRTALQKWTVEPCSTPALSPIGSDSAQHSFTGFRSFALPKEKELVLEIGEKGGARTLVLTIAPQQILKARTDAKAGQ
jgi:hypothetical protein